MWALLGSDHKTVIGVYQPTVPIEIITKEVEEAKLIAVFMHHNNSPAWTEGYYENGVFYKPKGEN